MFKTEISRQTKETKIKLELETESKAPGLYGSSGIGFFDHMLNTFAVHGSFKISLELDGDLHVDCHHTIEDTGIVLGTAFFKIIENANIARFGAAHVPMDESLAFCAADLGGRAYLVFNAEFKDGYIGTYGTQSTREFFFALAHNMRANIHINLLYGENDHHKTEAVYKSAARAIKQALTASESVMSAK
ncbi:MAG: imidazoleglycerol-phosphate dehydratase [Oscillospiraceae bacterium]|nr:imidazoleglycerol-phosphate dehydratase [Oscillospiraceae bacterium]